MSFLPVGRLQKLECQWRGGSDACTHWTGRSLAHNADQSTSGDPRWLSIANRAMAGIAL